jgi:hypothetical protein
MRVALSPNAFQAAYSSLRCCASENIDEKGAAQENATLTATFVDVDAFVNSRGI